MLLVSDGPTPTRESEMTRDDLTTALTWAIAEQVARAMGPIAQQYAPYCAFRRMMVGEHYEFAAVFYGSAELVRSRVEEKHGELHAADAYARLTEAAFGAFWWQDEAPVAEA